MKKLILGMAVLVATLGLYAQEPRAQDPAAARSQDPWSASTFANFRLRAIGPALMSGRVSAIAGSDDKQTWYVGVASGGVWKTTNAGITWTPVFQNEGAYSIGAVTIDPATPARSGWARAKPTTSAASDTATACTAVTMPAGRGGTRAEDFRADRAHCHRSPRLERGLRRGLRPAVGAGGERGLYKTTDGGTTWNKVLEISEHTGITDVAIDPNNPDVMLAVAHQRRRHTSGR